MITIKAATMPQGDRNMMPPQMGKGSMKGMYDRSDGNRYVIGVCATWIVLIVAITFNILAVFDVGTLELGVFTSQIGVFAGPLEVEIAPSRETFIIWVFIYIYQIGWLIYATANIYRKTPDGVRLYIAVPFTHWSTFVCYIVNLISNIVWLLLRDRGYLQAAMVPITLNVISCILCTALSAHGCKWCHPQLLEKGMKSEYRYTIGLAGNGFALFGTWTSVEAVLNLNLVTEQESGLPRDVSGTTSLCVLTFGAMVYFLFDLGVVEEYTRFIGTPYLALILYITSSLVVHFSPTSSNAVFCVMLDVAVVFMMLLKGLFLWRNEKKKPAFPKIEAMVKLSVK